MSILKKRFMDLKAIEKIVRVRDKRGNAVPFRANAAQAFYW